LKKQIFIIRHGQTDLNKEGIVQGRGVDTHLNETGKRQAALFFESYQDIPFDKIYTSCLQRTWESVEGFIKKGIPWEKLDGLDEMDWGIYEGKSPDDETREAFRKLLAYWSAGDYSKALEGGESPLEVQARQKLALEYIMSHTDENTILIAMHGRAIRLFMCLITHTELKFMDSFQHQNLSLYRIEWDGEFKIIDRNNTEHLTENPLEI